MLTLRMKFVAVVLLALFVACQASPAYAAVISLNLASENGTIGANTAGVVPAPNWNEFATGVHSGAALIDSFGATVPGLTFSVPAYISGFDNAGSNWGAEVGNTALMGGMMYQPPGGIVDLTFTGTVPYSLFDVYVYYNSGDVSGTQLFSIRDSGGATVTSQTGFQTVGADTAFILSTGANDSNYVKFTGLTDVEVGTNFTIRSQAGAGEYVYISGVQFVGPGPVTPEPSAIVLLATGLLGLLAYAWRKRK